MNTREQTTASRSRFHRTIAASATRLLLSFCFLITIAAPPLARAEENSGLPTVGQRDKNFAHEAARGLLRDIRIASIAQQRAAKKPIKTFMSYVARRRVDADAALRRLIANSGLTLPTRLDAQQRQEIDALQKLQGAEFDKAALRAIANPQYVHFFENELNAPTPEADVRVKAYARKELPIIRKDMQAAQRWLDGYDRI